MPFQATLLAEILCGGGCLVERKDHSRTFEGPSILGQVVTCVAMGAERLFKISSVRG